MLRTKNGEGQKVTEYTDPEDPVFTGFVTKDLTKTGGSGAWLQLMCCALVQLLGCSEISRTSVSHPTTGLST